MSVLSSAPTPPRSEKVDDLRAEIDALPLDPASASDLRGSKTLLIGPPGTGKTYSLTSYIEAGLELFVVITDPGGEESLLEAMERKRLPLDRLHYQYIAPASSSWHTLMDMAEKINAFSYKDLTELKHGINKSDYKQFYALLGAFFNFTCDRTGESFGPIDKWGTDRALGIDSASGINIMAMDMMIGAKPAAHQGEWGVAMNAEEKLIQKLCSDLSCFMCLTAHLEKEMDEILGRPQGMAGFLGRKLAPKLPRFFSDIVLARKDGDKFFWSTADNRVDLKARNLPYSDSLQPSFNAIVRKWKARNKQVEEEAKAKAKAALEAQIASSDEAAAADVSVFPPPPPIPPQ